MYRIISVTEYETRHQCRHRLWSEGAGRMRRIQRKWPRRGVSWHSRAPCGQHAAVQRGGTWTVAPPTSGRTLCTGPCKAPLKAALRPRAGRQKQDSGPRSPFSLLPTHLLRPPALGVQAVREARPSGCNTHLYWDCSLPPTSGDRSFCSRIRMMLTKRTKLTCRKETHICSPSPGAGGGCGWGV